MIKNRDAEKRVVQKEDKDKNKKQNSNENTKQKVITK